MKRRAFPKLKLKVRRRRVLVAPYGDRCGRYRTLHDEFVGSDLKPCPKYYEHNMKRSQAEAMMFHRFADLYRPLRKSMFVLQMPLMAALVKVSFMSRWGYHTETSAMEVDVVSNGVSVVFFSRDPAEYPCSTDEGPTIRQLYG